MKRGISLAALVATITIMIILVSTVVMAGNNMYNNVKKSNFLKEINSIQESVNAYLDKNPNEYPILNNLVIDLSNVSDENKAQFSQNREDITNNMVSLYEIDYEKIGYNNLKYGNKKQGTNDVYVLSTTTGKVYYSKGFKVGSEVIYTSTVDVVNIEIKTKNRTINGNKSTYNNPIIPVGFKPLETDVATWEDKNKDGSPDGWNDGLVIQDDVGNEFVWVPVDGTTVSYAKWCTKGFAYNNVKIADVLNELPSGVNENTQIQKYGGFYIGRYEAGTPDGTDSTRTNDAGIPLVQKGKNVWTNISYTNANTSAKMLYNNLNVKSGLLTGTMWDTVCKWISNAGINVDDSRTWGNYKDSQEPANVTGYASKQMTGFSEYWKAKNIYDLSRKHMGVDK